MEAVSRQDVDDFSRSSAPRRLPMGFPAVVLRFDQLQYLSGRTEHTRDHLRSVLEVKRRLLGGVVARSLPSLGIGIHHEP